MRRFVAACLPVTALALAACSPFGNGAVFNCTDNSQCVSGGQQGLCEQTAGGGVCAFSDSNCPGGYSFGDHAGVAPGTCVGATTADSGVPAVDAQPVTPPQSDAPLAPDIDARECWGSTLQICTKMPSTMSRELKNNFNTDGNSCDAVLPQAGSGTGSGVAVVMGETTGSAAAPDLCVMEAQDWTVYSLNVTGSRPLVIFATDTITLPYTGGTGISTYADSNDAVCPPLEASGNGVGGAGGAFATAGGGGGAGNGHQGVSPTAALAPVNAIRGGCTGQKGDGNPGAGGGAVYLLAGNKIDLSNYIMAVGKGGSGGASQGQQGDGGGGGGTGGFIGLEAPTITVEKALGLYIGGAVARGAGGGGGGGVNYVTQPGNKSHAGTPGGDGQSSDGNQAKGGSGGTTSGGAGGDGNGASGSGRNGQGQAGGGGGGGGDGVIWVTGGTLPNGTYAPTPIVR